MTECKSYWENLKFNDHDDYERVKACLSCPIRDINKYSDLVQEFKKMFEHIDRHTNEISFVKCQDQPCCKESRV